MDLGPQPNSRIVRSFSGCWTCRLRRKKCDESRPACDTCSVLHITCYYGQEKPQWMDGGVQQAEMAEQLKREVREQAHHRRGVQTTNATTESSHNTSSPIPRDMLQRGFDCALTHKDPANRPIGLGRSDTVLFMFYLETLVPFLFPHYRPSVFEGGKAWILELIISSPVVRQAILCQSSYFYSLSRGITAQDPLWDTVLGQTRDAFAVLRQSLQIIQGSELMDHLHGAARILAGIMQVQRFEVAVLSFENCHAHLNAALDIFERLLDSTHNRAAQMDVHGSGFKAILELLGPPTWVSSSQGERVPSAEQAAFSFSSALLVFDDIVASTLRQTQPKLYEYHHFLLRPTCDFSPAPINLEAVVGCQNWVLLCIAETSVLDAWKQERKNSSSLDLMELVRRASLIKDILEARISQLESSPVPATTHGRSSFLDMFTAEYGQQSNELADQTALVTRVWAHAALIHLFVTVSGWQPGSAHVRYHVGQVIELLSRRTSPPALLRTMVWPLCVAGCLAESSQEARFRGLVGTLKPTSIFGTVHKALEIMEDVWKNRNQGDATSRSLATCFQSQSNLILLV